MIETGMVQTHEVFLPYLVQDGRTLFEVFVERKLKALPCPAAEEKEGHAQP